MSYLSRILKKQYRILKALETTPFIILKGLGLDKIVVFPERRYMPETVNYYSKLYQSGIDSGKYKSIKEFDSIHTADIEFDSQYHGKFIKKYHRKTKEQLINLGKKWRGRISAEHPDAHVWIVVYYDCEYGWFLDTFNWNLTEIWETKAEHTIWL